MFWKFFKMTENTMKTRQMKRYYDKFNKLDLELRQFASRQIPDCRTSTRNKIKQNKSKQKTKGRIP